MTPAGGSLPQSDPRFRGCLEYREAGLKVKRSVAKQVRPFSVKLRRVDKRPLHGIITLGSARDSQPLPARASTRVVISAALGIRFRRKKSLCSRAAPKPTREHIRACWPFSGRLASCAWWSRWAPCFYLAAASWAARRAYRSLHLVPRRRRRCHQRLPIPPRRRFRRTPSSQLRRQPMRLRRQIPLYCPRRLRCHPPRPLRCQP